MKEKREICKYLNIKDCYSTTLNKKQYSIIVNDAYDKKIKELIKLLVSSVKCEKEKKKAYGRKEYLKKQTIQRTRTLFRTIFGLSSLLLKFKLHMQMKNPAYGRQRISRPMRIVGRIQFWRGCKIYLKKDNK